MISVHRARDRFETTQPGITTRHCFSSGSHYDPANVAFGPLIAVDEHRVAPGAGFAAHRHRGVELVSWVVDGVLRHSDATGRTASVYPGEVQYQNAGSGIEHVESNGAGDEPLRFVQMWLTAEPGEARYAVGEPPVQLAAGGLDVHRSGSVVLAGPSHLYVARGSFTVGSPSAGTSGPGAFESGTFVLGEGDSVRADEPLTVDGQGELLVLTMPGGAPAQPAEPPATV